MGKRPTRDELIGELRARYPTWADGSDPIGPNYPKLQHMTDWVIAALLVEDMEKPAPKAKPTAKPTLQQTFTVDTDVEWTPSLSDQGRSRAIQTLEVGESIFFPKLAHNALSGTLARLKPRRFSRRLWVENDVPGLRVFRIE